MKISGVHLGRFLQYLQETYGITDVDLVGHSMGGLFSRAAIRDLSVTNSTIHIDSLTTIGTPWQGSLLGDFASGAIGLDVCQGDTFCEKSMEAFKERTAQVQIGASQEVTDHYLDGTGGWEAFQAGVLDNIPVTLIGGTYFDSVAGDTGYWPNDGIVALSSALAVDVPSSVLPSTNLRYRPRHAQHLRIRGGRSRVVDRPDVGSCGAQDGRRSTLSRWHPTDRYGMPGDVSAPARGCS